MTFPLNDPYKLFREYAVRILGSMGSAADAVPELMKSSEDGTLDALLAILPEFAHLRSALEVILGEPEYRNDLIGLSTDEVRLYLRALANRRNAPM